MEEENMIELIGEDGKKIKVEILDIIEKEKVKYLVALPEDSEDEVVILKEEPDEKGEEATYTEVLDDTLADEIFNEYMSKIEDED